MPLFQGMLPFFASDSLLLDASRIGMPLFHEGTPLPVLMVNGSEDYVFSLRESQDPLFRMLGTPAADKRHAVLDTPHDVTAARPELVKIVLGWLDKYLGRVD